MKIKHFKRIYFYSFLLIAFLCAFLFSDNVFALTSGVGYYSTLYIGVPEHDAHYGGPALAYYTLDGNLVYCIEMTTAIRSAQYYEEAYSNPHIAYALSADHGYTWNDAANFQIRQAVIWALLGQINIESLQPGDWGCIEAAKRLYYEALAYNGTMDNPGLSDASLIFDLNGTAFISNVVTVSKPANCNSYNINVGGLPVGSYVSDIYGNGIGLWGLTADSTTFKVNIPAESILTDITGIDISVNAYGTLINTYRAYYSPTGSQALLSPGVTYNAAESYASFYLGRRIDAVGDLVIIKSDEYGNTLEGTTFRVSNGSTSVTGTTGTDGTIRFSGLRAGTYTIAEIGATTGYYNDRVEISQNVVTGLTAVSTKVNRATKGRVRIIKEDKENGSVAQGNATLAGAVYKIYAAEDIFSPNGKVLHLSNGTEAGTCITDASGTSNYVENLPLGKYIIKEVTPSTGYLMNPEEIPFTLSYENQDLEFVQKTLASTEQVIINDIHIIKKLQKTDSTPQMNLSGAKFSATLKSDRSKVYYSTTTDASGYCTIENLPYGTYEVEEIVVPDLALKIDNFDVFIEQDSSQREPYTYTKENVAKKMKITVNKRDVETGEITQGDARLDDAEYTIYRDEACTQAIETIKIADLKAESKWYLVGTYYIKETKRPEGYLLDGQVYRVTQVPSEQTEEFSYHEITSTEQVEKGDIYIVKFREENTNFEEGGTTKPPATGVELTLTLNSNHTKKYTATIDEKGYAEFTNIPYGWYTITETKSIPNVDIMDPQPVYVSYDKQKLYYIVQDPIYTRRLKIIKVDTETGRTIPLSGAVFKIWDVAEQRYIKQTTYYPIEGEFEEFGTASDGTLTLPHGLVPGNYELEEISAPFGYTLSDTRVSFTIEATTPENPERLYEVEVDFPNIAQKANVIVFKKGEVFTSSRVEDGITRPVYEQKGLEGVEYTITAEEDIVTPDGTVRMVKGDTRLVYTGADGIGKSEDLYLGSYSIMETRTIDGYLKQSDKIPFVLEYKGQEIKIYERNFDYTDVRQKLVLKARKNMETSPYKDILDNAYKNVVLGIYSKESLKNYKGEEIIPKDTLVDKVTINDEGTTTNNYDLPLGKYYIKEIETNENYKLNDTQYEFEFASPDDITPIININYSNVITNTLDELGNFRLYKIAKEDNNIIQRFLKWLRGEETDVKVHPLSGATFKIYYDDNGTPKDLYKQDGSEAVYITNAEGILEVKNLPFGKYYYQEIKAPLRYELDNNIYEFTITKDNVSQPFEEVVTNRLIEELLFTKLDAFDSQPIPNCEFEITDEEDNVIFKEKTDENGEYYISIDLIKIGEKYYYEEISAPDIYELNDEKHEFTRNEDGTFSMDTVDNLRKTTTVVINKTDLLGGNKIPNCTFELKSLETDFVVTGTTDENGEYYFEDVPYGRYIYTEISAPEEYILDTTPHEITVDENIKPLNIINELKVNTGDRNIAIIITVLLVSTTGIVLIINRKRISERIRVMKNK